MVWHWFTCSRTNFLNWVDSRCYSYVSYHFCSILLLLSRPEAVRFLVIGILDSKLDQGSYRGSVNSKLILNCVDSRCHSYVGSYFSSILFKVVWFFVINILDSKIDQGSYILGLLDRYLALPKFQSRCMGRIWKIICWWFVSAFAYPDQRF